MGAIALTTPPTSILRLHKCINVPQLSLSLSPRLLCDALLQRQLYSSSGEGEEIELKKGRREKESKRRVGV